MVNWSAQFVAPLDSDRSAVLFREEFSLDQGHGRPTAATLHLSALGVCQAWLNGRSASTDLLTPGWTSYEWRVRYVTYDVLSLLEERSVLGIAVGNGWYRGRLAWGGARALYGDELAAFAELRIQFADGHEQVVATGDRWSSGPSPVVANDLYDGEDIDGRLKDDSWLHPGFSSPDWGGVEVLEGKRDLLVASGTPPTRATQELSPVAIWSSPSGATLVDYGQNVVGWVRVRVVGPAGATITLRHAEVLDDGELGVRPLRTARATDNFTLSGGEDVFEPTFTFHGFRYVEVSGWPGGIDNLKPEDLTAVVVGADLERIGYFRCSNDLLNKLHDNVVWGMRGNFLAVPTDCPQRDERLGWTGDISAFAPTACFLYDVDHFLSDWLVDLKLEQDHNGGVVPFVVPDVLKKLPRAGREDRNTPTAMWADAAVWVPWALWEAYGDRATLDRQFDSMTAHARQIRTALSDTGLWDTGFQFGDWLDPDAPPDNAGAAKADKGVVATACAFRTARLVSAVAAILDRPGEQEEFEAMAAALAEAFIRHYVQSDHRILSDCPTVYALAIAFRLLDPEQEAAAGRRLAELVEDSGFHIGTGFIGTPFVLDALTRTGHLEKAYQLLLQTTCPSWLYPVTMGATTVWERWDSLLPDGTINPGEMTSFNHYAYGAVGDWLHRTVGGLSALEPGYARILIAPRPGGGITSAETALQTPHGRAAVRWEVESGALSAEITVPPETSGLLTWPGRADQELASGIHHVKIPLGE